MPKIISYTPSWLCRPSPGFHLFSSSNLSGRGTERGSTQSVNGVKKRKTPIGPLKTIARRGTEIFVVVDNEIRWSDLCLLKGGWEKIEGEKKGSSKVKPTGVGTTTGTPVTEAEENGNQYRVLKYPVGEPIQQLSVSPNGTFLAISTSHTVHVALLPDSSHLGQGQSDPMKLKGNNIGPITHVLSQSRVVSVLWHPFGVLGTCLVTVTAEAVVRVWELDRDNRWSFDSPSLAIDLKKLVLANSEEDDCSPGKIGRNKVFSPDAVGMEAVSACFGGTGSETESAWSAMTLWIGMQDGEVYALCPLLPTKWVPSEDVIPSLAIAAVSKGALQEKVTADLEESRRQRDQFEWMSDIDKQEPKVIRSSMLSNPIQVYSRPLHPGPIPRLQGPFQIFPEDSEQDLELSDLYVIAAKLDRGELMDGEDSDFESDEVDDKGLSASVICLVTKSGSVLICLDLNGVEGEWLPRKKSSRTIHPPDSSLVPFEILETLKSVEFVGEEWPTFSPDPYSPYSFFVTHSQGVYFFSMDPWLKGLENELQTSSTTGSTFRINVLQNGPGTLRECILFGFAQEGHDHRLGPIPACMALQDSDLGYFMLSSIAGQPQAVIFDKPCADPPETLPLEDEYHYGPDQSNIAIGPPRSAYEPPASLWEQSSLPTFVNKQVHNRHKRVMKEEIRLSAVTLGLMTDAHRIVSQETYQFGVAAADLFRRCQRLQEELRNQIKGANDAAYRIEGLLGKNADDYRVKGEKESGGEKGKARLLKRLEDAKERQKKLVERHEKLTNQVTSLRETSISEKEEQWMKEIHQTWDSLSQPKNAKDVEKESGEESLELWKRFDEVKRLAQDLISRTMEVVEKRPSSGESENSDRSFRVPLGLRRATVDHVMDMLARESALVNAAESRLQRLSIAGV